MSLTTMRTRRGSPATSTRRCHFQLLKVFFVVRERWWEEDVRANPGVTRYPTREVYFWKSRMKDSRRGLVMLYTDRPAATFWANYVPGPIQDDIDELCRPERHPRSRSQSRGNHACPHEKPLR